MTDLKTTFLNWYDSFQSPLARLCFWVSINEGWYSMGHKVLPMMLHLGDDEQELARQEFSEVGFTYQDY